MNLIALDACPGCASPRMKSFSVGSWPMRRCRDCSLVYAAQMAEPASVYDDDYLLGDSDFGLSWNPLLSAIATRAAEHRFDLIEAAVPVGRVLDVGCGTGEALQVAANRGWEAVGVEPVPASAEVARASGLEVHGDTLRDAPVEAGSFDVVCSWHVLEHLAEPVDFLRELATYARDGGLVAVETPNWLVRERRQLGESWDQLCPGEHVSHFTPRTLKATMARAGLDAEVTTATVVAKRPVDDRLGRGFALIALARA